MAVDWEKVLKTSATGGIFGSVLAHREASKYARRAAWDKRQIQKIQRFQQGRAFMNRFHAAQGAVLAGGAVSGAGLGSSGVQGQLASQATQARVGMKEFGRMSELDDRRFLSEVEAQKEADRGALLGGIGDAAMKVAKIWYPG